MADTRPRIRVLVAVGAEVRDWRDHKETRAHLDWVAKRTTPDSYAYEGKGRDYEFTFAYTKAGFASGLDLDGGIVIYQGHSRYGQGPAFGDAKLPTYPDPAKYPVNPWGDHFRMGFDAVHTACLADIWNHGVEPKEYTRDPPPKDLFAWQSTKTMLTRTKGKCGDKVASRRSLLRCAPDLTKKLKTVDVIPHRESLLDGRHYWYTVKEHEIDFVPLYIDNDGYIEYQTIVESSSKDLETVGLKCSLLYMNSCSSKLHFSAALKRRKTAVGSKCVFYLANEICYGEPLLVFIRQLLDGVDPVSKSGSKTMLTKLNESGRAGKVELVS